MPWRNLLSPEFTKKSQRAKYPCFVDTLISLKHSVGLVEKSLHAENQINPFIPFVRTPTDTDGQTDRQTDRQTDTDGHRQTDRQTDIALVRALA